MAFLRHFFPLVSFFDRLEDFFGKRSGNSHFTVILPVAVNLYHSYILDFHITYDI
jgi:hypothetical protein